MPRVAFLQVGAGGSVEHTIADLAPDGSAWDTIDEDDDDTVPTVTLYGEGGAGVLVASQLCGYVMPTALSAASAAGGTTLEVDDVSGLSRWGEIVVGPGADGRWEWAILDGVTPGDPLVIPPVPGTLHLLSPLRYAYADGSAVGSRTLTATYTDAQITQVLRGCRLEWAYQRGGKTRVENTIVHLSKYAPRYSLTAAEVMDSEPKAERMLGPGQRLDLMIRRTWDRRVLPSIARIMPPGALVSGEAADELLLAAVCQQLTNAARDTEAADRWGERYETLFGSLKDTLTDINEDGEVAATERPRNPRAPRLMRG